MREEQTIMKKILSAILVLTMVLSLGCAAFADSSAPTVESTIFGIYQLIKNDKVSPVENAFSVISQGLEVVKGEKTIQEKAEEINILPTHTQYKSINEYAHYFQIANSDGEILLQKEEVHVYGLDGVCAKCGHKFGGQDHIHTAAGFKYIPLNSGFHETCVVCACGEIISIDHYDHHNFDKNGVCVDCGYGAKEDPTDPGKDDPGKDPGDEPGKDPVNPGPAGPTGPIVPAPDLWKEAEHDGSLYQIYLYKPGTPDGQKTWEKAQAFAEGLTDKYGNKGHLVAINSDKEQGFLEGMNSYPGYYLWIGAERVDKAWTWVNGDEWGYENWAKEFPTDVADELFGAMVPYEWYNLVNEGTYKNLGCIIDGFIVEFEDGNYGITIDPNVTAEAAKDVQVGAKQPGAENVEISNIIASIDAETAESVTPAWLYIVCAVAAMALAGGIVVIVATKKKAE